MPRTEKIFLKKKYFFDFLLLLRGCMFARTASFQTKSFREWIAHIWNPSKGGVRILLPFLIVHNIKFNEILNFSRGCMFTRSTCVQKGKFGESIAVMINPSIGVLEAYAHSPMVRAMQVHKKGSFSNGVFQTEHF